ncbi:retroviral-like aspartic protease family protein [Gemmata sp. JC673]|uniref:Retroviral-like aspartic protease family protein n=1 Tax=Gemmata algarum TaxID=2975278 RepID=A0ABU5F0A5_9BACT|nr:retroviral-like aspartic protease family protein [Gemmata algarum]MDY3560603.1 retroviral-like aspartic protease family protein [Gemmata algarum]
MNRAWTLVVLAISLSATADGRPKPVDHPKADPFRQLLEKKGYVAVPLAEEEGQFTVECRIETETCRLLLDTGAESSSLDAAVVKKLGLRHGDEVKFVGIGGVQTGHEVSLRGLRFGDFDTRTMAHALPLRSVDLSTLNAARDRRKHGRIDGLLGDGALRLGSAVIDYPNRTLYLRTPLNTLWPEVEGRWVGTSGQEDGRGRKIDPKAPPRLEFKDRALHLTDGEKRYRFGVHVRPESDRYTLVFFDPEKELAKELKYEAGGLLKVSGGKLTVCLCLDPSKAKKGEEFPDDFKTAAGSGHLLLEFQRDKPLPVGPPVAALDPLRAGLEKKSYVAVPLTEEQGGWGFIVGCTCGTESVRLLLDTGAEVSALDASAVKKLGLKPKREVIAVGTGGEQDGVEVPLRGLSIGDFDTRTTADTITFAAFDLTAMNNALVQRRKSRPIDGLLGHAHLRVYAAVIDYSARTLYLRTPRAGLWPEVEGRWVATSGQEDGRGRKIDPKAPPRLEFKDRALHLTDGEKRYRFGVHVLPAKNGHAMWFFNPEEELGKELNYQAIGLLKVADGRLTVCLCLDPATAVKGMPDDFKAPADSGRLLLEFRREK